MHSIGYGRSSRPSWRRRILGILLAVLIVLLAAVPLAGVAAAAGPPSEPFRDLAGHWSRTDVLIAKGVGLINGYPDGTFKPNGQITRAEFLKIAVEAFGLNGTVDLPFTDAAAINASWAGPYVQRAVAGGLVTAAEYPAGLAMNTPITRGEIARIVVRGIEANDHFRPGDPNIPHHIPRPERVTLRDVPAGSLGQFVRQAVDFGVIKGYEDSTFRAGNTATRAEAAVMIKRAINLLRSQGGPARFGARPDSELVLPVAQLLLAGTASLQGDRDARAAMLQWGTADVVDRLLADMRSEVGNAELGIPMPEFPMPYEGRDGEGVFIGRDMASLRVPMKFNARLDGQLRSKTVLYVFQARYESDKWHIVDFLKEGTASWASLQNYTIAAVPKSTVPGVGVVYETRLTPEELTDSSIAIVGWTSGPLGHYLTPRSYGPFTKLAFAIWDMWQGGTVLLLDGVPFSRWKDDPMVEQIITTYDWDYDHAHTEEMNRKVKAMLDKYR